ncbi:MAG: trypsin-like serine protease, partial [Planctomycetota bacterium]
MDALEQRTLLTVGPADWTDILVNEAVNQDVQNTMATNWTIASSAQSVAVDHDGDFVVAWTRYDGVFNDDGTPVIDPNTGAPMVDANVYARYFTDEVQRLTLPDQIAVNQVDGSYGRVSLVYGGNEVQKISFDTVYEPFTPFQTTISGSFKVGFDVNGNGQIGTGETATIFFSEFDPLDQSAANMQTALQGIGGALADAKVQPLNPHEYLVEFGDASKGLDQPQITIEASDFTSGFLPSVLTSTIREPVVIANIPVSPDDPALTAQAIEQALLGTSVDLYMGPIRFPPPERLPTMQSFGTDVPREEPDVMRDTDAHVMVEPVSLTVFDLTFTGIAGKKDHPELVLLHAQDDFGNTEDAFGTPLLKLQGVGVETLKEPSPEFRVNPEEPDSPFTPLPDKFEQKNAAVAMDADGDFVIAWESEVPNSVSFGSVSDIFARRFSPAPLVEPEDVDLAQGIRPLGNEFQVNTFSVYAQTQPSVGMDDDGNFVVAWATGAQDISFFNGVMAQRYNRDGDRLGGEMQVNTEDTAIHYDPFVAVSHDGNLLVTWSRTTDPDFLIPDGYIVSVQGKVFAPDGQVLIGQFGVGGGGGSAAAWDAANNFLVTWSVTADSDNNGRTTTGVRAVMRELFDSTGAVSGAVIRDEFRVNSADFDPNTNTLWPSWQIDPQAGLDADGDLVIAFSGYGPDASEDVVMSGTFFQDLINSQENADLLPYFDPSFDYLSDLFFFGSQFFFDSSGSVDGVIERVLIEAMATGATDEQVARLGALLEQRAGLLRGDADGVMYSRFDADPRLPQIELLFSDCVANAERSGHNDRYIMRLSSFTSGGNMQIDVWAHGVLQRNINFSPVITGGALNVFRTRRALEDALRTANPTGENWPGPNPPIPNTLNEGPVEVRVIQSGYGYYDDEIMARLGTPWDLVQPSSFGFGFGFIGGVLPTDAVYEITFQGDTHDTLTSLGIHDINLNGQNSTEIQLLEFSSDAAGYFALMVDPGNLTATPPVLPEITGDILFDPSLPGFPDTVAQQIENELWFLGYFGADVTALPGGPPYQFLVVFNGMPAVNVPTIQEVPPTAGTPYPGFIFSTTLVDGLQGANSEVDVDLFQHTYYDDGVTQSYPAMAMEPDGDFVAVWTQSEEYTFGGVSNQNIYYRRFDEVVDSAGPLVTEFTDTSGNRIEGGAELTKQVEYLVISFDEDMMRSGTSSVTDLRNWALLCEGVEVLGGIRHVEFGMNKASELAQDFGWPLDPVGTNKWEAVIQLDGNGPSPGTPGLLNGNYEIVVKNSVEDRHGNPLGRTGFNINGQTFSRPFGVTTVAAGEILVNSEAEFQQITREMLPDDTQHSPQALAADADGDYVVVWADDTFLQEGVYAKMYDASWADTPEGRVGVYTEVREIRVTDDLSASFASVARDEDGDFVVTWSEYSPSTNWDIYARRYDAAGNAFGEEFLVNSETEQAQRYSTVAMDADGDFVVTWQSYGQDGSGYGVYAQRYDPAGTAIGGVDERQQLTFVGKPVGTFSLYWDGDPDTPNVTNDIAFNGSTFEVVDQIEAEMARLGAEVEATAVNTSDVVIRFIGIDGSQDQPQIAIADFSLVGEPGAHATISTVADGAPGEFRVNDTTENNQRFPTIAMSALGEIVISWTSAGQNGDAAYETNVYGKQFVSNEVIQSSANKVKVRQWSTDDGVTVELVPWIVTTDLPANHLTPTGAGYDGVTQLIVTTPLGVGLGSGSLLTTGQHILTAAHVVADNFGNLAALNVLVQFDLPTGVVGINSSQIFIHPDYDGNIGNGSDVAIITLQQAAPAEADRYDIYRSSDEIGKAFQKVGYGRSGDGNTGDVLPSGIKRDGENRYDALGGVFRAPFPVTDPDILVFDFDNGLVANDALGVWYGINDLGLGNMEVNTAPGDSGGPAFINGLIAGVTSGGITGLNADILAGTNSSFGEFSIDARVSAYADWIDRAVQAGGPEFLVNQTIGSDQKWSVVAMDKDGDFVITWTSYGQDGVGSGPGPGVGGEEGIFARRYGSDATALSNEFQVNTFGDGEQQHSQIFMDADGDFVVAWESFQDRPLPPTTLPDEANSFGVFAQRYARTALSGQNPFLGPNGELGGELPVSSTKPGDQRYPSVALDDTGDYVVIWSGLGEVPTADEDDDQGVFHQRFTRREDDAGPTVADVINPVTVNGDVLLQRVTEGIVLESEVNQFLVSFGEDLTTTGGITGVHSVLNTANWQLRQDGTLLFGGISNVQYGLNLAFAMGLTSTPTDKYEALVTFDADPTESGIQALGQGAYTLTVRDGIEDLFENPLDGDFDGSPRGSFHRGFSIDLGIEDPPDMGDPNPGDPDPDLPEELINPSEIGNQDRPAVATNASGDYVVVWVDTDTTTGDTNIVGRLYDRFGNPQGAQFTVNQYTTGPQIMPDVAMDSFGNFVVTWSGEGEVNSRTIESSGVFARAYDAFGTAQDDQFMVNQFRQSVQDSPAVAKDANGDFVITWTSYGQDGDRDGIYARRYDFLGQSQGDEFQVNSTWSNRQQNPDVATDDSGNFAIVWSSYRNPGENSEWGVFGQRFDSEGNAVGGEFRINNNTNDDQLDAHVAMDSDGDFAVAWSSFLQDGNGWGIFARRYSNAGVARDANEFLVNQTILYWQHEPAISMDSDGRFAVTWTTTGQDNVDALDEGIFTRIYEANGSDYVDQDSGQVLGEFQVNAIVAGDQNHSDVAMDADGDFVVVWQGPDADQNGIYGRIISVNLSSDGTGTGGTSTSGRITGNVYSAGNSGSSSGGTGGGGGTSTVLKLEGSSGNDTFEVVAGPTAATSIVKLNGVEVYVAPSTTLIQFVGQEGDDKVRITGTAADESVDLWPSHGTFTAGNYHVTFTGVETVVANGGGGADVAVLRDAAATQETFKSTPEYGLLYNSEFANWAVGFRYVHALSSGGNDVAKMYDDAHTAETLKATPDYMALYNDTFYSRAVGFRYAHAVASSDNDVAKLYDDPQAQETFYATPDYAALYDGRYYNRAVDFRFVHAVSSGGNDIAKLYDDANTRDTYDATPNDAALYNTEFYNRAVDFRYVHAVSSGGDDVAKLYDDANTRDTYKATPNDAALYNDVFYNRA